MLAHKMSDLLSLLALSIFIDKKVFSQEIDTFMHGVKELQDALGVELRLTEASTLSWFDKHREELKHQVESHSFSRWIAPLLERLKPLKNKKQNLDVMYQISISDDEFHPSEKKLISLAANHWDMRYTPPKVKLKK